MARNRPRNSELVLYGLAKALESGVSTYMDRQKEGRDDQRRKEEREQDLMRWTARQDAADARFQQREKRLSTDASARRDRVAADKTSPFTSEDFFSKLGTAGARTKWQDFKGSFNADFEGAGAPRPDSQSSPEILQQMIKMFSSGNPIDVPTPLNEVDEWRRQMEEGKLTGPELDRSVNQSVKDREKLIYDRKNAAGDTRRVQSMLQEQLRRMQQQGQSVGGAPAPGGSMGAPGGSMGMAQPSMPALDPLKFSQLPQGESATPGDEVQLGTLARSFNILMNLQPGGASLTEMASAYQWFADNTPTGRVPLWVEMMAQGVPGQQQGSGEMPAVRDLLG